MFHAEPRKELEKSDLVNLARKLMLNKIEIEGNEFNFSCIESGIRCPDLWARAAQNVAQVRFFFRLINVLNFYLFSASMLLGIIGMCCSCFSNRTR